MADPTQADGLLNSFHQAGLAVSTLPAATPAALQAALAEGAAELVVIHAAEPGHGLPGLTLPAVVALAGPVPVIALAASLPAARAAFDAGAAEVVVANQAAHLALAVDRARRQAAERRAQQWAADAQTASHDHYRQLFTLNRGVRLLLDPAGQILEANQAAAAFYGLPVAELAGLSFAALCLSPASQVAAELAQAAASEGRLFACRQRAAAGEPRDVEIHASQVHLLGRTLLELSIRDLGERLQREREWDALAQLGAALRLAATRADLLGTLVQHVPALLEVEAAAVVLPDALSGELVVAQAHHWPQPTGTRFQPGQGLSGAAMAAGRLRAVDLPSDDAVALGLPDPGALRIALAAPLFAQGQTIGALCVGAQAPLTPAQTRLLTALADMAAGAIHRTTLHEQVEQRLQRLAALHAIDLAIASSFDLRVTLNVFLDHLLSQLRVDAGAVLLLNEAAQSLHYAAVRGLNVSVLHQPTPRLTASPPGRVALQGQSFFVPRLADLRGPGAAHPPSGEVFVSYYGVPLIARGRVQGVLEIFQRTPLDPDGDWVEYLNSLATQAAIAIDNATLFSDLQRSNLELNLAYEATIESWARMLEARGIEAGGHTRRVADRVVALGRSAGLSETELLHLRRGALLHDIGMLGVPESIVLKATTYSRADFAVVQQHPLYGFEILAPIAYLRPAIDIPYAHHERWDGSGYPRQLRAEGIPLPARLFAVVDVWDALITDRAYRPAWPEAQARHYLREQSGQLFDPHAVDLFLQTASP